MEVKWASILGRKDMLTMNDASKRCKKRTENTHCSEQLDSHMWSLRSRVLIETRTQGFVGQKEVEEGK